MVKYLLVLLFCVVIFSCQADAKDARLLARIFFKNKGFVDKSKDMSSNVFYDNFKKNLDLAVLLI